MRFKAVLLLCSFCLLASCSNGPGTEFPIAAGPLKPEELAVNSFGQTPLVARVFDVVNQDTAADKNTGLASHVQPMPVDILSSYAAGKFHANGGPYIVRFVVRQASFQVRSTGAGRDSGWFNFDDSEKAELSVDLNVMVTASQPNGTGATITATTQQAQQVPFGGTPEEHRAAYMALMMRALQAIDGEISRQLPTYFNAIVAR